MSSDNAERFVCAVTRIIGPRIAFGNCRTVSFAFVSDSIASANVKFGFPVNSHVHTMELVSITRSKYSLEKEAQKRFVVIHTLKKLVMNVTQHDEVKFSIEKQKKKPEMKKVPKLYLECAKFFTISG